MWWKDNLFASKCLKVEEFPSLLAPSYGGKLKRFKLFPMLFTTNFPETSIRKKLFNSPLSSAELSTQFRRLLKSVKERNGTKMNIMLEIFLPFHQWTAKICRVSWCFRGVVFLPLLPLFRSAIPLHSTMPGTWNARERERERFHCWINQDEECGSSRAWAFTSATYLIHLLIVRLQRVNGSVQVLGTRRHRVVQVFVSANRKRMQHILSRWTEHENGPWLFFLFTRFSQFV